MNPYLENELYAYSSSSLSEIKHSIEDWMQSNRYDEPAEFFSIRDQINQQLESQL